MTHLKQTLWLAVVVAILAPGAVFAQGGASCPSVIVLRLSALSESASHDWLAPAMHQSMLAELARTGFIEPISLKDSRATTRPVDLDAAVAAGKAAKAAYVVFGSYQVIDDNLRVTGQIAEVESGKVIGGFKATGNVRDLFGIEDILATQMKQALAKAILPPEQQKDVLASTDPFSQQQRRATTMPAGPEALPDLTRADGTSGYEGSDLQRALQMNPVEVTPAEELADRQRYLEPPYYPEYGYRLPYGYDYYGDNNQTIIINPDGSHSYPRPVPGTVTPSTPLGAEAVDLPQGDHTNGAPGGGATFRDSGGMFNDRPGGGAPFRDSGGQANTEPGGGANFRSAWGKNSQGGGAPFRSTEGHTNGSPGGGATFRRSNGQFNNSPGGGATFRPTGGNSVSGGPGHNAGSPGQNTSGANQNTAGSNQNTTGANQNTNSGGR